MTYTGGAQGAAKDLLVLLDQKLREQRHGVSVPVTGVVGLGSGVPLWNLLVPNSP